MQNSNQFVKSTATPITPSTKNRWSPRRRLLRLKNKPLTPKSPNFPAIHSLAPSVRGREDRDEVVEIFPLHRRHMARKSPFLAGNKDHIHTQTRHHALQRVRNRPDWVTSGHMALAGQRGWGQNGIWGRRSGRNSFQSLSAGWPLLMSLPWVQSN